jgi:hypothetical protein
MQTPPHRGHTASHPHANDDAHAHARAYRALELTQRVGRQSPPGAGASSTELARLARQLAGLKRSASQSSLSASAHASVDTSHQSARTSPLSSSLPSTRLSSSSSNHAGARPASASTAARANNVQPLSDAALLATAIRRAVTQQRADTQRSQSQPRARPHSAQSAQQHSTTTAGREIGSFYQTHAAQTAASATPVAPTGMPAVAGVGFRSRCHDLVFLDVTI